MRKEHLYSTLYQQLISKIEKGVFCPGDKLPSLLQMSKEYGVSKNTVLRAYGDLESAGLITTQQRSGHIVLAKENADLPRGRLFRPQETSRAEMVPLIFRIQDRNRDPSLIPFGGASLANQWLPEGALRSSQNKVTREKFAKTLRYEEFKGAIEFRRIVAQKGARWGSTFSFDECLITAGGTEALSLAIRATTNRGDLIAVESPTYFGLLGLLEMLGRRVLEIPTDPVTGIDIKILGQVFKQREIKACVLIPNFQNPLGSLMPDQNKKQVVALASQYKIPIIESDTVADLYLTGARPRPLQSFDFTGWILSCGSFSKIIAPGLRLGYLSPGRFLEQVEAQKRFGTLGTSTGPQLVLAHFLRQGKYERHLKKLRGLIRPQLPRFIDTIERSFPTGTRINRPQGGHLIWVELPQSVDGILLAERAWKQGISLTPGALFSRTHRFSHFIRLNCGLPWNISVEKALKKLGSLAAIP